MIRNLEMFWLLLIHICVAHSLRTSVCVCVEEITGGGATVEASYPEV